MLGRDALDLGEPGPDTTFGAGRIRVDVEPPQLRSVIDLPRRPMRGRARVAVEPTDAGPVATWVLTVDGVRRREGRVARDIVDVGFDTRAYSDGPHTAALEIGDTVGNVGRRGWRFVVDNTAPVLTLGTIRIGVPTPAGPTPARRPPLRPIGVEVTALDGVSAKITVTVTLQKLPAGAAKERAVSIATGATRAFGVGAAAPGTYRLTVVARDDAGNATTQRRTFRVPGRA